MKYKTTKKATQNNYNKVIKAFYAELHYLLKFTEPVAYTSGVYGWNADIYDFGNTAIVTGYRPFGNVLPDYDVAEKYNQLGKKSIKKNTIQQETGTKKMKIKRID